MSRPKRAPSWWPMVVLVALATAAVACGTPSMAGRRFNYLTPTALSPTWSSAAIAHGFTNAVPETPWWHVSPPQPPRPQTIQPISVEVNLSSDVLFASGSAHLSVAAPSQLAGILQQAVQVPSARLDIRGFTDDIPDPSFPGDNQGLSIARSQAVADYFESMGISPNRIGTGGFGASQPLGPEVSQADLQANRRTSITLTAP